MTQSIIDLSQLPAPDVVEQLSFEQLFKTRLQTLLALDPSFSALLESDPAIKLLEADSYDEMILRQRINDAARARLLAFAAGGDLEQLAAFYGVTRLTGEADEAFRIRIQQAIMGRSAAGTAAQYRFAALTSSIDVADANVDSPSGGVVRISVLSRLGDGTPSGELMAAVSAVVLSDDVRALCHDVQVVAAEIVQVDVTATIYLTSNAPQSIFESLPTILRAEFEKVRGLGYNVAGSWLSAKLQASGVQRVVMAAPAAGAQIVIAPNQCAAIRNINLTLAGRDY